jgi:two-component system, cell cycle sensor histidine kinase and response regulator CckA
MAAALKVLVVEDSETDAELLLRGLNRAGYSPSARRVDTATEMEAALSHDHWDLIISDYVLPQFSGLEALKIIQRQSLDIPFIIVSGKIGEETAIEALKAGAHDYLLKDRLTRLGPAIERALREAAARRQRRESDHALRESEERYRRLVESSPEATFICAAGYFVYVNPSCVNLFGALTPVDLIGKTYLDFVDPAYQEIATEHMRLTMQGADGPLMEFCIRRMDGSTAVVEVIARSITYHREQAVQMIARDVTARKSAEEETQHSARMDAVARLAGGVANDFNNLLAVITGYAGLIRSSIPEEDKLQNDIDQITRSADRAFALTQELAALSRKQTLRPVPLNLNSLIVKNQGLLTRVLGEEIELHTSLAPDLSLMQGDEGQIENMLMNLAARARDSMQNGGRLIFQTCNLTQEDKRALPLSELRAGDYICLLVADNGPGIPKEAENHIFEPFFNTAGVRTGAGLALATVYATVKQHGGHITYQSQEGSGSTFRIHFPRVPVPVVTKSRQSQGTILLVEDEEPLREFGRVVLDRAGYQVIEASDGEEAIALCEKAKPPINLIFTDVIMPFMSGPELTRRLSRIYPGIPVLYTSGYTRSVVVENGSQSSDFEFLQKPYTSQELIQRLQQILATPKS